LQQPLGHDAALHTQLPPTQPWPAAQATQALPAEPQLAADEVWHMPLLSQQPLGQVVALHEPQVWLAALHSWPAGQSAPLLQPQTPLRQTWPTALVEQSRQAPPVVPQALLPLPAAQLPLPQQPPVHEPLPAPPQVAVQAPLAQVGVRSLHTPQEAPAVPHDELVCAA
jgi:hypothetical protein